MNYIKLEFVFEPRTDWVLDVFTNSLGEIGFESFVDTEYGLEAFIPEKEFEEETLNTLLSGFNFDVKISWTKELIADKNWNEEWEKNYFQPLLIGEECVVRAPFHKEYPNAKYEIVIEPNMAFGTGNHETTSMMVEAILEEDLTGKKVLDMGCGTGILGILAAMRGAEKITAIDVSEWAVSGTIENAALNNIQNIAAKLGDARLLGGEKYDFIFANIHKNILLEDMKIYSENLNKGGTLFLSGFYLEDLDDIKQEAQRQKLQYLSHRVRKNWVAATVKKK